MTALWAAIRILALAYLGYCGLLYVTQRSVLFPGTRIPSSFPLGSAPQGVEPLSVATPFGNVAAWWIGTGVPDSPALIFAHGNAELIEHSYLELRDLARLGLGVLLVEFPGYGASEGRPSRTATRAAFSAAFDRLASLPEVDPERIVAMGRSIGGGVAGDLAADRPVRALIFQSTFASARGLAWKAFRVPGLLVRDPFDNVRAVSGFSGPVLAFHGTRDEIIPFTESEKLARSHEGVELVPLRCGHNDCGGQWPAMVDRIHHFLVAHRVLDP